MSTIRPLATIALLAVVGVFLAHKINEGPAVALDDEWPVPSEAGDPPAWPTVETSSSDSLGQSTLEPRTAPAWDAEPAVAAPQLEAANAHGGFPALPALPAADEQPADEGANSVAAASLPAPPSQPAEANDGGLLASFPDPTTASDEELTLPVNIPTARYGATPPPAEDSVPVDPPGDTALNRAWPAIQAALERDELTRAHRMLTQWADEPTLSPRRRQEVMSLLGELAGTVVYSMEHRLAPAHTVAPGETLATIAEQYEVPWQLLAKINGVATSEAVQPGQTLKVVRGPFTADVRLDAGELVLKIDGRYAGKFPVRVDGQAPAGGDWRVGRKQIAPEGGQPFGPGLPRIVLQNDAGESFQLNSDTLSTPAARGRLTIASADLTDVYDILSIGSPVTIRR